MTYYEVRRVDVEPPLAFQAACNACQRSGLDAVAVHTEARVAIYSRGPHFKRGSLAEFITVRAWKGTSGTVVGFEGTPALGPWSRATVDRLIDDVRDEFDAVLSAPAARMRDVKVPRRMSRPFGQIPRALAVLEVLSALVVWLWLVGGAIGQFATAMAAANALLVFVARPNSLWRTLATATAVLNVPTGLLGIVAGRMALAQALWPEPVEQDRGPAAGQVPVVRAPDQATEPESG